jgi:hypothetical protein
MKSTKSELVEIMAARSAWLDAGVASRVASDGEGQWVSVLVSGISIFRNSDKC